MVALRLYTTAAFESAPPHSTHSTHTLRSLHSSPHSLRSLYSLYSLRSPHSLYSLRLPHSLHSLHPLSLVGLNRPLRENGGKPLGERQRHPFPVTVVFLHEALKKLRAVEALQRCAQC